MDLKLEITAWRRATRFTSRSFLRLGIFLAGRLRRPRPSAGPRKPLGAPYKICRLFVCYLSLATEFWFSQTRKALAGKEIIDVPFLVHPRNCHNFDGHIQQTTTAIIGVQTHEWSVYRRKPKAFIKDDWANKSVARNNSRCRFSRSRARRNTA